MKWFRDHPGWSLIIGMALFLAAVFCAAQWNCWLYRRMLEIQNYVGSMVVLFGGYLAYRGSKDQAKATLSATDAQRGYLIEQQANTAANLAMQIKMEASVLERFVATVLMEFDRAMRIRQMGKVVATGLKSRVSKLERFMEHAWKNLEQVPVSISEPVGNCIVVFDDLVTRCSDFCTTLESDGHLPGDVWKKELEGIIGALKNLGDAISAYIAEGTKPSEMVRKYQESRAAYAEELAELILQDEAKQGGA